jgi:uncharacterized protein with von Willebrand factor type A (vWA) domain
MHTEEDEFLKMNLRNAKKRDLRIKELLQDSFAGISEVLQSMDDPNKEYRLYVIENLNGVLEKVEKARDAALRNDAYATVLRLYKKEE